MTLRAPELARLKDIAASLSALGSDAIGMAVDEARRTAGLTALALYSVDQLKGAQTLSRLAGIFVRESGEPCAVSDVKRAFDAAAASGEKLLPYDPFNAALRERNRLREFGPRELAALARTTAMPSNVWSPLGLASSHQLRVLLCDGRRLLGWLGSLQHEPPAPHAGAAVRALIRPFRERLCVERALGAAFAETAVPLLLERFKGLAAVVDRQGRAVYANAAARATYAAHRGVNICADPRYLRAAISSPGLPPLWLVLENRATSQRAARVAAFAARHGLTPRQREILLEIFDGRSNDDIADSLGLAGPMVETHVSAILRRARVSSRYELTAMLANYS